MPSDLTNIEKVCGKIPEDKIKDLTFDTNPTSIHSPMDDVQLNIIERDEPKCIKFEMKKSPIPVNLWMQILPVTDHPSKMRLIMKAEVNPFIKVMVKEPLQGGIEKAADVLQMIQHK